MDSNDISEMVYKNALAYGQPDYTSTKLKDDIDRMGSLGRCLSEVLGQGYACLSIKEHLFGLFNRPNKNGPAATFLFAGYPGTGKTFTAQKMAEALGLPFERFDMTGYSDKEAASFNLFGLNKSYRSAEPGRLTQFIKKHPVCVILFDEIEKCHSIVRNNMLQMFDKGVVRDMYYEEEYSVRDCIFVFTTNAGRNAYDTKGNPYNISSVPIPTIIKALEEEINPITGEHSFSKELVSRFVSGKIVVFNKLRPEALHRIAVNHMQEICGFNYHEYNIGCRLDEDTLANIILLSQGGDADVRSVIRATKEFFSKNLQRAVEVIHDSGNDGARICGLRYHIDVSNATPEVAELFNDNIKVRILVFGKKTYKSIPKYIRNEAEIFCTEEPMSIRDIRIHDPAIAIVGVTSDNSFKAKELFANLIELGIAVYVFTNDKNIQLKDYLEHGATDCFNPHGYVSFSSWVGHAYRGIELGRATKKLFRSNKVLTYTTYYKYSKRTCIVDVTLSDFKTQIAFSGGESDIFKGKAAIPDVRFDSIVGLGVVKDELKPIINQLKRYTEYRRNGIRIPRGIILDGPPGTGKTTIAKAFAAEARLPFIAINATEVLSKWVGEGEKKIQDIFAAARKYAPAVFFIDEVDGITKDRMGDAAECSHTEGLTNALLSQLDGFDSDNAPPVFLIAATNFDTGDGSKLDKAVLRRFDVKIHVGFPDATDREKFISRELFRYDFSDVSEAKIANIAKRSIGWSLSDLNLVIQNAIRHSESENGFALTDEVLEEAFASFNAGERKIYSEQSVCKTAYHEAGHAVVACVLGLNPAFTTIVARNTFGGYMQYSESDKLDMSRQECLNRICVALSGRATEVRYYGDDGITTGASSDIRSATELATRMVCYFGMQEDMLLFINSGKATQNAAVEERVRGILTEQYERAKCLVGDNAGKIEKVACALIQRESLTDTELDDIMKENV